VGLAGALGADRRDQTQAAQPAVFCDRDGVLNRRRPNHVKSVEEFEFLPGVLLAMRELARLEVPVVVVTNQSVIGRGLASEAEVERIHARMRQAVLEAGGPKLHVYVCPHAPQESCECRKPRPGLLLRAAAQLDIDLTRSVFVGDSSTDVCAALSAGCRPILVGQDCSSQAFWPDGLVSYAPSLLEALGAIHLE
ncbi:MAG TPA: HAD family hydrolase, partial [Chloroflexota bacterium]